MAVTAVVVTAVAGLVGGCGERKLDCSPPEAGHDQSVGRTVVLVDVTASIRSAGAAPDYPTALIAQINGAVTRGDVVTVGSFDGSAATVRWTVTDYPTASTRNRDKRRKADEDRARACLGQATRQAAMARAGVAGTDLLGALAVAGRHTNATVGRRTVVIATDGLSTVGCADFGVRPVGSDKMIEAAVAECPDRPDWPVDLAGTHLMLLGLGHPAEGQPVPETGHLAWLRQYWEKVCLTAQAAACDISTSPVPVISDGAKDGGSGAAAPHPDPQVTFVPGAGPPVHRPDFVTYPVPSAALFATGSHAITPRGRERLRQVAEDVTSRYGIAAVQVVGHTDSRNSPAHNQRLSERRAESAARLLGDLGLPVTEIRGAGEKELLCPREQRADGTWDQDCLQLNRRVEIIVTRESG
ncbi:OmpA family protein [Micromonospora sp. NPDC000207]|uniref:OmpA family protein n=1 Tax=Micromonospora sp. NPDC000207 TaxID=3154246 RepID=UPI00331DA695